MKETLIHVAKQVAHAQPIFKRERIPVVARVHGTFDGNIQDLWFVVGSQNTSLISKPHISALGNVVPRNSLIATRILNGELGTPIIYTTKNYIKKIVEHNVAAYSKADLKNRSISIADDAQVYTYDDINDFLEALQVKEAEITAKQREIEEQKQKIAELKQQENTAHQRSVLTKGLQKMEEEKRVLTLQQEEMSKLSRYIRKQGQLRFNPILDPTQNRIKTRNLYDGTTIIIDGGPGTGKTTTMIQRLKYLIDKDAIEEDFVEESGLYQLNARQRDQFHDAINKDRDWLFFSPSTLLKEYLSNAMNEEGLGNTNSKVWNWSEYCQKIIRENYLLIDSTNENTPFKASRNTETLIYKGKDVIYAFNAFLLNQLRTIKSRLPKIDENINKYQWVNVATHILNQFENCEKLSISQFVQLFRNLNINYYGESKELLSRNRERVKQIIDELYILCEEDKELYDKLNELIQTQPQEQFDETEEIEEEQEVDENEEDFIDNTEKRIKNMMRTWFRRYCYNQKNREAKLTVRQEKVSELLLPVLLEEHKAEMDRVGELVLFEQYAKYTRGLVSNMFGGFNGKYKRFRRQMLTTKNNAWNQELLTSLLKRREGKELHPQEQALLVGIINNLVKEVLRVQPDIRHQFVEGYKVSSRPIIGIDEVTDFSECDIYAMESLLSMEFNSLTLCGDLMQRLRKSGITDWEKVLPLVKNPKIVEMNTSYRQSSRLLDVAKHLYEDTLGDKPNYKAYMPSRKVPKPLAYISDSEEDKIDWIEFRIREVYDAYGKKLPSIAIFLNHKRDIPDFVENLKDTDFIIDAGIDVIDGSEGNVLASKNQIRVYPIDVVKGMEFDVVFFHNIDSERNNELVKRYIYVGVSRAAFFLGITLENEDKDLTKYFEKEGTWDKIV
ncbi:MAG: hypothetical protein J6N92_06725 [Alloprevotella sp.]|nr:hypothetical protein [Alloprevotella sp.]